MSKPREFWIRKGTNNFDYSTHDEDTYEDLGLDLDCYDDAFYDAIVTEPAKNAIHVIEYSAYDKLQEENEVLKAQLDIAIKTIEKAYERTHEENRVLVEALEEIFFEGRPSHSILRAKEALEKVGESNET